MEQGAKATRQKLVSAAFSQFLAHGYAGTGMNQIIAEAGLSKGAFYHHFKSKDDVYDEVISDFFLTPLKELDIGQFAQTSSAEMRTRLTGLYEALPQKIAESAGISVTRYYALLFEAMARRPLFASAMASHYSALIEAMTHRIYEESGVYAKVAENHAHNMLATLEGRLLLKAVLESPAPKARP